MKKTKIVMALLATILLINFPMILVRAQTHNADAMWVEPSSTVFDNTTASVGTLFNVTVWLNMTENIFAYQVGLHYNRTQLKCTRADFTATGKSNYFAGHTTTPAGPIIDTGSIGNGSVMAGESLSGNDFIPGPKNASLIWIEFQILIVPSAGNFTSKFDLTTETDNGNNYVLDTDLNTLTFTPYDGNYQFTGPPVGPPPSLSVSISANSTSIILGQSVLFTSTVTGGSPPITAYQWFLNSTPVSGATSSSWTYTPAENGSATVYLNVTDSKPTIAQSNLITVTITSPGAGIHDVAVTDITLERTWIYQKLILHINVTTDNLGNFTETFNVTLYADTDTIGMFEVINLSPGNSNTTTFGWNTTSAQLYHNYTISAQASPVPLETNLANNLLSDGIVSVRFMGDVNGDERVNIKDVSEAAKSFGSVGPGFLHPGSSPSPGWNADADVNGDNKIDLKDLILICHNFGKIFS